MEKFCPRLSAKQIPIVVIITPCKTDLSESTIPYYTSPRESGNVNIECHQIPPLAGRVVTPAQAYANKYHSIFTRRFKKRNDVYSRIPQLGIFTPLLALYYTPLPE